MKHIITLLIICSSLCQVVASTQTSLLTQDQLVEVLVDLELTKVMIYQEEPNNPHLAQALFQEQVAMIFNAHATDQTSFQESYFHYLANPKQFKSLQEKLILQLEKLLQATEEKK